ncbi:MAG: hypothetical protein ACXWNQ_04760 [Anaerolineales bacterium]
MPERADLLQLSRQVFLSRLASVGVLLAGLFGLMNYFMPALLGVGSETNGVYRGELPWLLVGIVLTGAGICFLYILNRWPAQLRKIVLHAVPVRMIVKLEVEQDSDSTTYYAVIRQHDGSTPAWRAHIWVHPRRIREDLGSPFEGGVFLHSKTGLPAAIRYSKGMLWVMAGNGAVTRLPDDGPP